MADRKSFKIYVKRQNDPEYNNVIEGQCDRFDNNLNRFGKTFTLSSTYRMDSSDLSLPANELLSMEDSYVDKVEVFDDAGNILFIMNQYAREINYSVVDQLYQPFGILETLRFNLK